MTIQQKSIAGFTSDQIATWAAQTGTTPVFTDGDPLLAVWQSVSVQLDFLQAQIQLVLLLARATTSVGADLDTWMAQFGFIRLPATYATGAEVFSNPNAASSSILVPVGSIVQTVGGGIQYAVVSDPDEPTYNVALGGYILAPGQLSLTATVEALVGGSSSNVLANTLVQFGTSLPGIASVTNPSPITNGVNAESDAAFRARFVLFLGTLAQATMSAILAAAEGVQQGLLISLLENQEPGTTRGALAIPLLGSFTVVVDDGSGDPPQSLLNAVYNAVYAVRAFSVQAFVTGPQQINTTISLAVNIVSGATTAIVIAAVQNAVAAYVNSLGPGVRLNGSAIITTALAVSGVAAVNPASVLINGAAADLIPAIQQEARVTVANVSVATY